MTSVWDDPELVTASEYVKFENPGDTIAGIVRAVQVHRWDDGTACPKLVIETDDGDEKALTASQMRLKAILAEQRPEAGDHIVVTFSSVEKRPGGKTLKHFDVTVTRGGKQAAPAPAAASMSSLPPLLRGMTSPAAAAVPAEAASGVQLTAEQAAAVAALKAQGVL